MNARTDRLRRWLRLALACVALVAGTGSARAAPLADEVVAAGAVLRRETGERPRVRATESKRAAAIAPASALVLRDSACLVSAATAPPGAAVPLFLTHRALLR